MVPPRMKMAVTENPKKLANLIDLVNLPSALRDFLGQSQISRLGCFMRVWSYIKTNNLQDPNNKNIVNCDEKLKSILLGKPQIELLELPVLIKLHFPKEPKWVSRYENLHLYHNIGVYNWLYNIFSASLYVTFLTFSITSILF